MKTLVQRNPLLAAASAAVLLALAVAGYALAVDHGSQDAAAAPSYMSVPF